jgi:glycosyltransferase involved in cell wall biosynthesis
MRRTSRHRRYDVVFYTPWVGSILSRQSPPPGGAETQVLMLARALSGRGLRVAIIVFGNREELPTEFEGLGIVARRGYKEHPRLIEKLAEIFRIWASLWRAPSHTIVYRRASYELGLVGLYAWLAGRHLVFASANMTDFNYRLIEPSRVYRHLAYKFGVRMARTIVVQTDEQAARCRSAFRRHPVVIKSLQALSSLPDEPPLAFLWIGRIDLNKRPLEYVALARAFPEAQFWMVGVPTPNECEAERLLAEAVVAQAEELPNLALLPPRTREEIGALIDRAVASVNTAEFEGMPNVLLEAWSRGVPALVLNHDPDGVVEQYQLGGYARGSFQEFVALAREQWLGRNARRRLSDRCRTYVEAHHGPDLIAGQWARLFSAYSSPDVEVSTVESQPTRAV